MPRKISASRRLVVLLVVVIASFAGCKKRDECTPKILAHPANVTITKGQSATLTVSAQVTGGSLAYRWYAASPSGSVPLDSETASATVTPDKTTTYFVWVYSACGEQRGQKISDAVVVTVKQ